jgi:ElaB/YqjD/DUF883 family membrane-anchored ribosome-binding protein
LANTAPNFCSDHGYCVYASAQTLFSALPKVCFRPPIEENTHMKKKHKTAALSREFHNFVADIESLLRETATLTGDELALARGRLQERVSEAKDSVTSLSHDLEGRARKTASKANREVHDEPWKAIGGAATAGLILGMLFSRR